MRQELVAKGTYPPESVGVFSQESRGPREPSRVGLKVGLEASFCGQKKSKDWTSTVSTRVPWRYQHHALPSVEVVIVKLQ